LGAARFALRLPLDLAGFLAAFRFAICCSCRCEWMPARTRCGAHKNSKCAMKLRPEL
jgi:hypothetical protein